MVSYIYDKFKKVYVRNSPDSLICLEKKRKKKRKKERNKNKQTKKKRKKRTRIVFGCVLYRSAARRREFPLWNETIPEMEDRKILKSQVACYLFIP